MKCPKCNETNHEPTAKFCHVCGQELDPEWEVFSRKLLEQGQRIQETWNRIHLQQDAEYDSSYFIWEKALRYLFLIVILIEYIYISILEYPIGDGWGMVTVGYVNVFAFIATMAVCVFANHYNDFEDKRGFWKFYYNWLHFIAAAIIPMIGYVVLHNFQNIITLILDSVLIGLLLLADFGTLEDIIDIS